VQFLARESAGQTKEVSTGYTEAYIPRLINTRKKEKLNENDACRYAE